MKLNHITFSTWSKQYAVFLLLAALLMSSAHAAIVATDNGLTAPTLGANDTGFITPTTGLNRIGWDNETLSQSFTVSSSGTIESIFIGYNAFDDGETITFNLSVNGNLVQSGIVLDGDNFSGTAATDGNGGPFYWMEIDLSAENAAVIAGSNSFELDPTAFAGTSWPLAIRQSTGNLYSGGALSVNGSPTTGDMFFAVTVIPEPSTALLALFAALALLLRRRRA